MMRKVSISEITAILEEFEIKGASETGYVSNVKPVNDANKESIAWISSKREGCMGILRESQAECILCDFGMKFSAELPSRKTYLFVEDPKLEFARIVRHFFCVEQEWGVHPSAVINENVELPERIYVGPFAYIGNSKIGNNCVIHGHAHINSGVELGENVIIHEHTLIGSDGFGYLWNKHDEIEKFHHVGKTVIEDNVEIFPYANVDRGTLSETRIGEGTKIDHYCHIGHNCVVGKNTIITAGTVMCGGSAIGNNTWIGVNSIIKEKKVVGNKCTVGLGSIVTKSVPDHGQWMGAPARPKEEFIKSKNALDKIAGLGS